MDRATLDELKRLEAEATKLKSPKGKVKPKNLIHAVTQAAGYEKPGDDPMWRLAADLMDG